MKVFVTTLGCKLNYFETEAITEGLCEAGFDIAPDMNSADTVIVNTCTVTVKADAKSRQAMRKAKRAGKFVVATGCYATTDFDELSSLDFIDLVVDNSKKYEIGSIISKGVSVADNNDFPAVTGFERTRGFVKIQDGCDKFCSYCKIPFARQRSRSLAPDKVGQIIETLVESGYREIVLTGVNISDYRYDNKTLASLVGEILDIGGDWRLRLSSLQPDEFELSLLDYLDHPRFTNHFHLSLQSGSDTVLERMNRHYTSQDFLSTVEKIRTKSPDCGITTDIIVGFPGETDKEFDATLDLVRKSGFTRVHIFGYSHRKGTRAYKLKALNGNVIRERETVLKQLAIETSLDFVNRNVIGRAYPVLIETIGNGKASGYTPNYFKITTGDKGLAENEFAIIKPVKAAIDKDGIVGLEGQLSS
jgi:threonylcarbamoyladenosine tRNA methylthiotransferase MtaB